MPVQLNSAGSDGASSTPRKQDVAAAIKVGAVDVQRELADLLRNYAGRPTPLYEARRLAAHCGRSVFARPLRIAPGGTHQGLIRERPALQAGSPAMLAPRSRRITRYAHFVRCATT